MTASAIASASFHLSSVTFCVIHLRAILQESNLLSNLWYKSTLVGNKIVDQSDAVGGSPVSAAPATS